MCRTQKVRHPTRVVLKNLQKFSLLCRTEWKMTQVEKCQYDTFSSLCWSVQHKIRISRTGITPNTRKSCLEIRKNRVVLEVSTTTCVSVVLALASVRQTCVEPYQNLGDSMAQWVLGVKILSGSKDRKFKPWPRRDFFAFFQKSLKFLGKPHF